MATTAERVKQIISEDSGLDVEGIEDGDTLVEGLGFDSLSLMQLGLDIEDSFAIEVPDGSVTGITTVAQLVEEVDRLIEAQK